MVFVVSYDVVDDRRRTRVAKVLSDAGTRVQFSVFELDVEIVVLDAVIDRLGRIVDVDEDSVLVYSLCERCIRSRRVIGLPRDTGWPDAIVV